MNYEITKVLKIKKGKLKASLFNQSIRYYLLINLTDLTISPSAVNVII